MRSWRNKLLAAASLAGAMLALAPADSQAVPAFARQTGMNCNSCHVGTDNVPNFTRTGRLFAMKGYTRPYVRERLRHDGDTIEDMPQYGGHYLALNWTDYWSARFVSELWSSGRNANGSKQPDSTRALGRMAMFYTGAITDWLGLWTEIGYLGNNTLNSVTAGRQGSTGLNFFAFDEYRLAASFDYGANSFWGVSLGNEHPNVVGQFNFPVIAPDMWYHGQGGAGRSKDMSTISLHTFFNDQWWFQVAANTGADNENWTGGWNKYINVSYEMFRTTRNNLWLVAEYYWGNDFPSIMSTYKDSFICPGACPPGVVDSSLSIVNAVGFTAAPVAGAPIEKVKDFKSWKLKAEWSAADRGPHTWFASAVLHGMKQDFESGGSVERDIFGVTLRYFFQRTYGFETYYRKDWKYDYVTGAGVLRDVLLKPSYGLTLYFVPAMNFSTHLAWNPRVQNIVYRDRGQDYVSGGKSYQLGFEYNF